jgi:hypothetical protein
LPDCTILITLGTVKVGPLGAPQAGRQKHNLECYYLSNEGSGFTRLRLRPPDSET